MIPIVDPEPLLPAPATAAVTRLDCYLPAGFPVSPRSAGTARTNSAMMDGAKATRGKVYDRAWADGLPDRWADAVLLWWLSTGEIKQAPASAVELARSVPAVRRALGQ